MDQMLSALEETGLVPQLKERLDDLGRRIQDLREKQATLSAVGLRSAITVQKAEQQLAAN